MNSQVLLWVIFGIVVVAMVLLDLAFFRHKDEIKVRMALVWSFFWIVLALVFNVVVFFWRGQTTALEFLTGYLLEKALSVDNLFVFVMLFTYFGVSMHNQRKALFWGVVGALIMRGIFIFAGITLIDKFHWLIYVFGVFLILTAIKMVFQKDKDIHPEKNPVLKIFRKFMPVTENYEGDRFFIKRAGRLFATPLFIVVLMVETTDVVFAVDSIPAVLAITTDPFVVYTSNIFAILGLRALFFALSGSMQVFHFLGHGLAVVLAFVGVKMTISGYYKMPIGVALGVIAGVLFVSIIASVIWPKSVKREA